MERPQWDRIQEIFYSTVPVPRSERSAFLALACQQDQFVLREVKSLLEADDSSGSFLEMPVFEMGLKIISKNSGGHGDSGQTTDTLLGTTIDGRYLVEIELGKGGMGKVYLARDLTLHNRPVVIKILLDASLQDAYVVRKFKQEVEALARLDHPSVVGVLGAGKLPDGKPYIVMQYVSGMTLRSQIPSEGMNLERAAAIVQQIGTALESVHEKGILHRDLKPDNIMLQPLKGGTELVKVVDFGIAKVKDSVVGPSTANNVPVGTALYMSPEQLRGGDRITVASDIYSMGVVAYEMVTGRRPFNPGSAPQLLEMHREGVRVRPIDLRVNLSTEAQAIILRALSFDPAARYQSATEFGDSLARALMNEGETAQRSNISYLIPQGTNSAELNAPAAVPHAPDQPAVAHHANGGTESHPRVKFPFKVGKNRPTLITVSVIVLLSFAGALLAMYKSLPPAEPKPASKVPTREFTYSLTVQKMRNRRLFEEPFETLGEEPFKSGDKFKLKVSSPEPGYLYLFNEGPPELNDTSFTIVYPTPTRNDGSATLGANQSIQTNWNTFKGETGTENFWIVWSVFPVSELEAVKAEAFKHPKGGLTGQTLVAVKTFLQTREAEIKARATRDKDTQRITVRGSSDVLVQLVELQHR